MTDMINEMYVSASFKYKDVFITPIEEWQLPSLRRHRNEFDTWINLSDVNLIHEDQQTKWYKNLVFDSTKKYFTLWAYLKEGDDIVGHRAIGLIRIDELDYINRSARVGCDIFSEFRGKGLGTMAMQLTVNYCFDYINMHRLWLLVAEYNHAAYAIYKKVGFITEGTQKDALYRSGKYNDYIMMSLIKGEENE